MTHSALAAAPLAAQDDNLAASLLHSGILSWIVLGLVCGAAAKAILPGRDPGGIVGTCLIGIVGAFLGGWLSSVFLHRQVGHSFVDPAMWVAAIAGALVLLVLYRIFFGNSRDEHHHH